MTRLAVIGSGMMGEALVRGLLGSGWEPGDVVMTDVRTERLSELAAVLKVHTTQDNRDAAEGADAVLLAVKPQDALSVLAGLQGAAGAPGGVLSIVAGLRTEAIENAMGGEVSVVRAMPNTPARVGKGVTALAPGRWASEPARDLATDVFAGVGPVVWVVEDHLDAVTALSGSGPAYIFLVAESLIEAGVAMGLSRDVATTLAAATIEGSGRMLVETGEHPALLRAQVTSPGGTTSAALAVLEAMSVRAAFLEAVRAATRRSKELA